jgi:thiamine biosynthesis lipoprotein
MNRRGFLRSSDAPARGGVVSDTRPDPAGDLTLVRVSRRAMATTFEVAIPYGTPDAVPAAEAALDLIDDIEGQITVYRDTSEVAAINARAADGPVPVERRLFDLLADCATRTRDTAGAFDIATGSLIKAWGFYRREGRIPSPAELSRAMANSGMRHVVLDANASTVKFRRQGLELNFGAVGKGYALDRAAELLRTEWGVRSALLSGGGSSMFALGNPPGRPRGWAVAVNHPHDGEKTLGTVWLIDQGFGTSAATFQFFEYNGRRYGHLLDPRTGRPAEGTASASAVATTATEADALSTAFFVTGSAAAVEYCKPRPGVGAVVLTDVADRPTAAGIPATRYDPPRQRMLTL